MKRYDDAFARAWAARQKKEEDAKSPLRCRLIVQPWLETERGWGQRPDGWSLHRTYDDAKAFIAAYWAGMPDGPAPDEYSRPCGDPYEIRVAERIYASVTGTGYRIWQGQRLPTHERLTR